MLGFRSDLSLDEQVRALKAQIRLAPADAALRVYYFQLLAVQGLWDKALEQLQLCAQLDRKASSMARAYREVIRCEALRAEVFAGRRRPFLVGEPEQWLALLIDALTQGGQGAADTAQDLRARALDDAPAVPGRIGEHDFSWLADSDTRLGPVCELIANGCYYWLPFSSIVHIGLEPVQDLRDLIWLPCAVTLGHGGLLQGFMPTRYPVSVGEDDAILLSRRTEWRDIGGEHVSGHGQRSWVSEDDEFAMAQVRQITFARLMHDA